MAPEAYFAACKPIHTELISIAERTRQMALTHCADASNPAYVSLMDRQDELLRKLSKLDAQMPVQ